MTPIWSKVVEGFIANFTLIETKGAWKHNQHGGRKGSSIDDVLVKLWERSMKALEPTKDSRGVVLCGVDFSKPFSRCSYQQILVAYQKLGAPLWVINMHAAFLTNRAMQVKIWHVLSPQVAVTGGAVQGSILAVMDHNAVLEDVDDNFRLPAEKICG